MRDFFERRCPLPESFPHRALILPERGCWRRGRCGESGEREGVIDGSDYLRPVTKQLVRARAVRSVDWPGDRRNSSAEVECVLGSQQSAALMAGFHDDRYLGERRDDAVPPWEAAAKRRRARRRLRQNQAALHDFTVQTGVPAGIWHVDARAKNSDGFPIGFEGSAMSTCVYATRHSTNHTPAGSRYRTGDFPSDPVAVPRAVSRANDRNSRPVQHASRAERE